MKTIVADENDLRKLIREEAANALTLAQERQPEPTGRKEYLTNTEAARYLDVSKSTLQRWRADDTLPFTRIGRQVFYRREDVLNVLDAGLKSDASAKPAS
ncbi:MAG: helix-turn-helix domain-containing protein [Bacteroidetes bacterium]|jgi:excisionase family DNA binding protein|nr:helix-turn-helix domain-containing protein [Bacteroidota bacterium]